MSASATYPKRLIEVDLPIKRISAHARREKSIRHGHISTLHIWWARRPLASCRAVICAALWPDPADSLCPDAFRVVARSRMHEWAEQHLALVSRESYPHFNDIRSNPAKLDHDDELLRTLLLDFIADFANWDNSTREPYLEMSRVLTQAAHEALGGDPGSHPLVADPFAGGGAIPLEALRVGADAFASDLNPVAVLLNKMVLEYIPKYGQRLADEVRKWGQWIKEEAEKELAEFYPKDPDGATPIAYLWARTIRCEGPGCGTEIPLIRSLWLAKRSKNAVALRLIPDDAEKRIDFDIIHDAKAKDVAEGTVRKGAAICPVCGFTTSNIRVRAQLSAAHGGVKNATLLAVVRTKPDESRTYRLPHIADFDAVEGANQELARRLQANKGELSLLPDEIIPTERPSPNARGMSAVTKMGIKVFGDLFASRPSLTLISLCQLVRRAQDELYQQDIDIDFVQAIVTSLGLAVDRQADFLSSLVTWAAGGEFARTTFARQALSIAWDYTECCPLSGASGSWIGALEWVCNVLSTVAGSGSNSGRAVQSSATSSILPDQSVQAWITDPPYYDAVPYADLSEFFYVWLRRTIATLHPELLSDIGVPKDEEAIWNPSRVYSVTGLPKSETFYEQQMYRSFREGQRIITANGIAVVVFAHKSTAGWETVLSALLAAGWVATASWPIDTERSSRTNAIGTASLASSIHIVCRPLDKSAQNHVGDWRDVLAELPRRIHEWMPRLVAEGVVGADAIFACLGPAVEIFSHYERVEKASGEVVTLREYLPHVWAAVSREALSTIFDQADATGFEEDARLTAVWLWTLFGGQVGQSLAEAADADNEDESVDEEDDDSATKKPAVGGSYMLEFDAARKIAQGLGAHLEKLTAIVEVKGDKARLLPVAERARALFGKEATQPVVTSRRRSATVQAALPGFPSKPHQSSFGDLLDDAATGGGTVNEGWIDTSTPEPGGTVLDRLHQGMLLFAAGRTEALRRFLIENGIGQDERFWRLAQALSALYPMGSDEKRWVDGVLARKKGWGL